MNKKYTQFKDAKIPWINKIPQHWDSIKLKYLLKQVKTGSTPPTNKSEYFEGTIKWFTPGDFKEYKNIKKSAGTVSELALKDREIRLLPKGTVLLVGIGATLGKVAMITESAAFNQQITGLQTNNKLNEDYLYYWLLINRESIRSTAQYTTLPIINNHFIKNFRSVVPPVYEQKKIVNYLNQRTSDIDELISDKKHLIELLEEKRQAIITETVKKGLNPKVAMKKSGIQWIGNLPSEWRISKIKYSAYVRGRIGWQGLRSDEFIEEGPYLVTGTDFRFGKIIWDNCYHISEERYKEAPEIQLKENDILITKDGTIGKVAIVKDKPFKAILNSGIFVMRPLNNSYLTEYMYWILNSDVFKEYIRYMETGTTIKHLYQATFVNFAYPLPPLSEQKEIVKFLNNIVSEIDSLIEEEKMIINKLHEYRQSLIYEAVTGKIDVRDYPLERKDEANVD